MHLHQRECRMRQSAPRGVGIQHAIPELRCEHLQDDAAHSVTEIGSSSAHSVVAGTPRVLPVFEVLDVLLIAQHVPEGLRFAALAAEGQPPDGPGIGGDLLQIKYDAVRAGWAGEAELEARPRPWPAVS